MVVLDDFLRSFRKFQCPVYLATQHLDLPPELRASIFANCSRFFAFAGSASDAALLGKEFGGTDGALVAARLPELRTGQAFVKVRGESVRLLHVSPVYKEPFSESANESYTGSEQVGRPREQIDKEIEQRLRRFGVGSRHSHRPRQVSANSDELPEGYDSC